VWVARSCWLVGMGEGMVAADVRSRSMVGWGVSRFDKVAWVALGS